MIFLRLYVDLGNIIDNIELIHKQTKKDIMDAIVKETGLKTKGGGIVFSLPISEAIGLYE